MNTVYDVAKSGVFNKTGLTAIESVHSAKFWDVMAYVSREIEANG